HYHLLGVPYTASRAEIIRAYRDAMKRVHPDHQSSARRAAAEEHAKQLNEAYAVLSKPLARQAYDRTIQQHVVQDQIMSRYAGGFGGGMGGDAAHFGRGLHREPTAAERRDKRLSDRNALISLLIVFGGMTGAVLVLLLLWAILGAISGAII
ncbi:MAG TPA: J domain-containing protein, partial [Thermomicrobiales bacterium]|nr:J domain-containing protein [Thermomicrobiales bacterium]